jgi:putative ATP-binding cassette transporter
VTGTVRTAAEWPAAALAPLTDHPRAWGLIALCWAIALMVIYADYRINDWQRLFYDMLQAYDAAAFYPLLGLLLTLVLVQTSGLAANLFLMEYTEATIRQALMQRLLGRFAAQTRIARFDDCPADQRIAEDTEIYCSRLVTITVVLAAELIKAAVFYGVLITAAPQAGYRLAGFDVPVPVIMGVASLGYFLVAWSVAWPGGRRLITLETDKRAVEADLRARIFRMKEDYAGFRAAPDQADRLGQAARTMARLTGASTRIARVAALVTWSNSFTTSVSMIVPAMLLTPAYFGHAITLGEVVQTTAAFGIFQAALARFLHSTREISRMLAAWKRIQAFQTIMTA